MPKGKKKIVEDVKLDEADEEVTGAGETPPVTKVYEHPVTKEDHLALYKLLQEMGVHTISVLENKISRLS